MLRRTQGLLGATHVRRRNSRPCRPRKVHAGRGAHRHRPRPARRGEGARADDRPRLCVARSAVRQRGQHRRRARTRALRQQHARRSRRDRSRSARRRCRRVGNAADTRAPRHPRPAPHPARPGRSHQKGPRRRRLAGACDRRHRRYAERNRAWRARKFCRYRPRPARD